MKEQLALIFGDVGTIVIVAGIIAGLVFVCVYNARKLKSLKKSVKTVGVIDAVEAESDDEGGTIYIITYSYTDNAGMRRTNKFGWGRSIGKAGDKLALFYDSQAPQNSIAECQVKYGKNLWWKVLIVLAAIIIPAVFLAIYFGK